MKPGGDARPRTIYLFTQETCTNCPAAKAVIEEALAGTDIPVKVVDLQEMDYDLEFRLLENQMFIASTPSVMLDNSGELKMLYSGEVPTVDGIRKELGVSG